MRRGKIEIAVGLVLLVCANIALIAMYRSSRKEPLKPQAPDVAHHVEDFVAEHRERLALLRTEWMERLGALPPPARDQAAALIKRAITSPKFTAERDALIAELRR